MTFSDYLQQLRVSGVRKKRNRIRNPRNSDLSFGISDIPLPQKRMSSLPEKHGVLGPE
jgi:hypothetical protein